MNTAVVESKKMYSVHTITKYKSEVLVPNLSLFFLCHFPPQRIYFLHFSDSYTTKMKISAVRFPLQTQEALMIYNASL